MAKKKDKAKPDSVPTGKQVHLSPEQCESLYVMLNSTPAKDAGGLRYTIQLGDLIKSLGSERKEKLLDERSKFSRRFLRVREGKEGSMERRAIAKELEDWQEEHKLTNECFPTGPETIAVTIPPESDTVLLNMFIHHSRMQQGAGLVSIMEFCDKFEFRAEYLAEAAKVDEDDEKKEKEARAAANK